MRFFEKFKRRDDPYIPLSEAAKFSPYSQEYLNLRARHEKLKAIKIGRDWFTTKKWLDEYTREQERKKIEKSAQSTSAFKARVGASIEILFAPLAAMIFRFGPFVRIIRSRRIFAAPAIFILVIVGVTALSFVSARAQLKTVKLYTSSCTGEWEKPELITGEPQVFADGQIEQFTSENSSRYTTGPLFIECEKFGELPRGRIKSKTLGVSLAIRSLETPKEELPVKESPPAETPSDEGGDVSQEGLPTSSEEILPEEIPEEIPAEEPVSFRFSEERLTFLEEGQTLKTFAALASSHITGEEAKLQEEVIEEGQPSEQSPTSSEETSEVPSQVIEQIPPIESVEPTSSSVESVSPLDLILRVSLSLDNGKTWNVLGAIDETPFSNALNGGYLTFDIPNSLFSFESNLNEAKVRVEGLMGTPNTVEAYVDSLWLDIIYTDPREAILEVERDDFAQNEKPHFRIRVEDPKGFLERIGSFFPFWPAQDKIDVSLNWFLLDSDGSIVEEIPIDFEPKISATEDEAEWEITLSPLNTFRPGPYTFSIKAVDPEWNILGVQKSFNWGLLAINTQKSVFLPNDTVEFGFSVLNEAGKVVCDASLALTITKPDGEKEVLSTSDKTISSRPECGFHALTPKPDYEATWELGDLTGKYLLDLEARFLRDDGSEETHNIHNTFAVQESVPFDIIRKGPARILPNASYDMRLEVKANENYVGQVVEPVPPEFQLFDTGWRKVITGADFTEPFASSEPYEATFISWNVEFEAGSTYVLGYSFNVPDISPQFWLLGPTTFYKIAQGLVSVAALAPPETELVSEEPPADETTNPKIPRIINEPAALFKEARFWQITADILEEPAKVVAVPGFFSGESGANEIITKVMKYHISSDGRIIAKVDSVEESVNGIFRVYFYKNRLATLTPQVSEDEILGILNVVSGEFSADETRKLPLPVPSELLEEFFPYGKGETLAELEVKKAWGDIYIRVDEAAART